MAARNTDLRLNILALIIAALGAAIVVALWYIQVVKGEEYERLATENRIRLVRIPAPRGIIYDRSGEVLADNRPGFEVVVNLPEVEDRSDLIESLNKILSIEPARISTRLELFRERPFEPVRVASDVGIARATVLEERNPELKGVDVQVNPIRNYPHRQLLAHLLGYVGQISPRELQRLREEGYRPQDDIGKIGVEEAFDKYLRGEAGGEELQVDARGLRDRVLNRRDPRPGYDLHLTVDVRAQMILDELMDGFSGSAVALDPRTGDILALVSKPGFDPNLMVRPVPADYLRRLFSDPQAPLLNRALAGEYLPGSPFKLAVAIAALDSGEINPETEFECNGIFFLGRGAFRCWKEGGHGRLNLTEAIKGSCNIYFYQTGLEVGLDRIRETALALGLGESPGSGLKGERRGFFPSREWKRNNSGENWYPGDTVNLSIGQGYILVTPLQMALFTSAIANGGFLYRPRLVSKITSPEGKVVREYSPRLKRKLEIQDRIWNEVREGMFRVVNEAGGTGRAAFRPRPLISGKTGTAQVSAAPDQPTNAWFLAFAPSEDPTLALAMVLEGAGTGGEAAAPLAGEFFERYFSDESGD